MELSNWPPRPAARRLEDSGIPPERVQALYLGNFIGERLAHQGALAPIVARRLGLDGIPATKVEAACASGGIAVRHGYLMVTAGVYDVVLVAGVEKMSDVSTGDVTAALATAGDEALEMRTGLTFPGGFAMVMQAHMARYGTTREQVAAVSVKNHANRRRESEGAVQEADQYRPGGQLTFRGRAAAVGSTVRRSATARRRRLSAPRLSRVNTPSAAFASSGRATAPGRWRSPAWTI